MSGSWVVAFNCGEAIIVERRTRQEAEAVIDDLGCPASAVHPLANVVFAAEPWVKNGQLRCDRFSVRPR